MTKILPCAYSRCSDRRAHWCTPHKKRKHQIIYNVPDNKEKAYCSFECAIYDGAFSVTKGWKLPDGSWENG